LAPAPALSEKLSPDKIKASSPEGIRNSIEVLAAKALQELDENKISYGEKTGRDKRT